MFYVYALYSKGHDKIYVGYSSDVQERLSSHNHPLNRKWTGRYKPWIIIYTEELTTKKDAIIREKQLKSYKGRMFVRSLIPH